MARARGAKVLAITASHTPLAREADIARIVDLVDHAEDVATQLPMVGRMLHLLMIDILAVAVAMRRGAQAPGRRCQTRSCWRSTALPWLRLRQVPRPPSNPRPHRLRT